MKRADEAIGGRDIVDPRKRQLLGQAIRNVPNIRSLRARASGE